VHASGGKALRERHGIRPDAGPEIDDSRRRGLEDGLCAIKSGAPQRGAQARFDREMRGESFRKQVPWLMCGVLLGVGHGHNAKRDSHRTHKILHMTQEDAETIVRQRIRGLRVARGWTLDTLAARCYLSPSTVSRIETGRQRIALEQLVAIAKALGTSLDQLVEPEGDEDVVIRPEPESVGGATFWLLSRERDRRGVTIGKMRLTEERESPSAQVHPGYEWFTVLSGTIRLTLGTRTILVAPGQAVEFSTMTPHRIEAHRGPADILTIFDHDGQQAHLPGHGHPTSRTE
jgi:transcriptional regulator with XRE-family HTH domain